MITSFARDETKAQTNTNSDERRTFEQSFVVTLNPRQPDYQANVRKDGNLDVRTKLFGKDVCYRIDMSEGSLRVPMAYACAPKDSFELNVR
jgi:hypothetical protein